MKNNISTRILNSIKNLENKIMTYPVESKIKSIRDKYKDKQENRELVVVDKYGNRYYQYYSHHGLPTRRIIHLNQTSFNKWNDDPIMLGWLERRKINPPTQEELEKIYIEQEEFQRRCLEWDRKENLLIEELKKRKNEALENERKETKSIGEGDNYRPGLWDRSLPVKITEEKQLVEGVSKMPGKYIVDFLNEDEIWMKMREQKMLSKFNEAMKNTDLAEYTEEIMAHRAYIDRINSKNENIRKIKQMTNLGKRMIEKDKVLQTYGGFRARFKDVFKDLDLEEQEVDEVMEKKI